MDWKASLKSLIPSAEKIDFSSNASILRGVLEGTIFPEISINSRGKIVIPERFSIKVGANKRIFQLLLHHTFFNSTPLSFRKSFLDLLYLILRRNVYDVIRFQSWDELLCNYQFYGLNRLLLVLLKESIAAQVPTSITKRIIHLIGVVGTAGISVTDFKCFLNFLKNPSELAVSLLQALKIMIRQDNGVAKASPSTFFNFAGPKSGLYGSPTTFPFPREVQFCTWFRIENFEEELRPSMADAVPSDEKAFNSKSKYTQHLMTWCNSAQKGMDVYIDKTCLVIAVSSNTIKADPILLRLSEYPLRKGVWYHLAVRHSKPRLSLLSSDEIFVFLDQTLVFQDTVRFPSLGNSADVQFSFGRNLDGQMTPIYLFYEALSPLAIESIARLDAGKLIDGMEASTNQVVVDLLSTISASDRKAHPLLPKVMIAFHPMRCLNGFALDIHSGRHARLGPMAQTWSIVGARDLLPSMGGLSCLLPLFPRLLIENEGYRLSAIDAISSRDLDAEGAEPRESLSSTVSISTTGLGTSVADLRDSNNMDSDLDYSVLSQLKAEREDLFGDGCVGLLLSILAKCITSHRSFQQELVTCGGIEMIEYALTCVPAEILQGEGEKCVLALIQLKSAASEFTSLELRITKSLLCNMTIWHGSSFQLLSSLMSVILAAIRAQPDMFLDLLGVKKVLQFLGYFIYVDPAEDYFVYDGNDLNSVKSPDSKLRKKISRESSLAEFSNEGSPLVSRDVLIDLSSELEKSPKTLTLEAPDSSEKMGHLIGIVKQELMPESPLPMARRGSKLSMKEGGESSPMRSQSSQSLRRNSLRKLKSFKVSLTETIQDGEGGLLDNLTPTTNSGTEGSEKFFSRVNSAPRWNSVPEELPLNDAENSAPVQPSLEVTKEDIPPPPPSVEETDSEANFPFVLHTNEERKHLRSCLESMIVIMVQHGCSDREINPLMDFLVMCKDRVVLNEIAQILLYLLVDGDSKILSAVVTACHGPEEFASFVLLYMIHQPYEELRCTGIRLLTHFYLRIDLLPVSITNLTLRKRKGTLLPRAVASLANLGNGQGLQRLQLCGGLALLCEVVGAHASNSTELTYSALLELLMTKPGSKCQITIQYSDLFNIQDSQNNATPQSVVFAAHYISPELVHDEATDMTNALVLPIFFELLPKLPISVHENVYGDLLALLKHSSGNRQAFIASPSWHLCMFGLVSQLVDSTQGKQGDKKIDSFGVIQELERWTGFVCSDSPLYAKEKTELDRATSENRSVDNKGELLRTWDLSQRGVLYSYSDNNDTKQKGEDARIRSSSSGDSLNGTNISPTKETVDNYELWFALGMKVYATLLLHAMDYKGGWREIDRSISQSYESEVGYSMAQTVLSHVLNELTFNMRSKYKELQRLAKSSSMLENQDATDKLENFLSLLLSASQIALIDQNCTGKGIFDLAVSRSRIQCLNEVTREFLLEKTQSKVKGAGEFVERHVLSQLEIRNLLVKAEVRLAEKYRMIDKEVSEKQPGHSTDHPGIDRFSPVGIRYQSMKHNFSDQTEELTYHEFMDFHHVWQDISVDSLAPPLSKNSSTMSPDNPQQRYSRVNSVSMMNGNPFKSIEELLHPLERSHDISRGQLILVLQTLRFFDVMFWPNPAGSIRNAEMLRFHKDKVSPEVVSVGESGRNSGTSSKGKTAEHVFPLSVFSAVMRMCLFVQGELSPVTHLAVLNLKRMRTLVTVLDKVTPYNTPTHDWLLASVLHTTLGLQRLMVLLEPVYQMVGINDPLLVKTVGPWDDSYDDFDRLNERDATRFQQIGTDNELLFRLESYFDSSPGRNLIRNVRASLYLLAEAFELHHSKLATSLEERTFRSLWVLVEQFKSDVLNQRTTQATEEATDVSPTETVSQPEIVPQRGLGPKANSVSSFNVTQGEEDTAGDIYMNSSGFNLGSHPRGRSQSDMSDFSETGSVGPSISTEKPPATTLAIPAANNAAVAEDNFFGSDILLVLRWLRYPYLRTNPFRSVGIVKSVDALQFLENRSSSRFVQHCKVLKQELEKQRDLAVKSIEEMTELKELSLNVHDMMRTRQAVRAAAQKATENLKLKNVAARWHDCLKVFENSWSPWFTDDQTAKAACAQYELSKHMDLRLRKMLLTRVAEPIDHSEAAYLEGKIKDQQQYADNSSKSDPEAPQASGNGNLPAVTSRTVSVPFKISTGLHMLPSKDKGNTATWGDEEDDGHLLEEGVDVAAPAGGISEVGKNLAQFFQGSDRRPPWTSKFQWAVDEKCLLEIDCLKITLDQVVSGALLLTNKSIYFHPRKTVGGLSASKNPFTDSRWHLDRLIEAYGRRYLLQNCAIELFFVDSPELFLAFNALSELQKFFRFLRRQFTPLLITPRSLNPRYAFQNSPWTEMWRRRLISNFEYLMRLNVLAGRSFNDITQYPVFPWVIADYSSTTLDLHNPATFRPLNKPVGALSAARLKEFLERYKSFDDEIVPKFMYGSHYSSAGIVLHYMIRQEPFTSMGVNFQGGRFDCPDRIFFDIARTWQGCNQSMSDVKEMIPEMYCCPEALLNTNSLPLGELQEGGFVDHVVLPPWAKDAYDFIRLNRAALESEYVSAHLHEWIDLIFGFKQNGPAAVAANNVFYYLTYENAVNLESIEDELQRDAAKTQVLHFGQTPSQLLRKEHPARLPKEECAIPLCSDIGQLPHMQLYTPSKQLQLQGAASAGAVISIRCSGERLIVCHANLSISSYRWSCFPDSDGQPFTLKPDKNRVLPSAALSASEEILKGRSCLSTSTMDSADTAVSTESSPSNGAEPEKSHSISSEGEPTQGTLSKSISVRWKINTAQETSRGSGSFFGSMRDSLTRSLTRKDPDAEGPFDFDSSNSKESFRNRVPLDAKLASELFQGQNDEAVISSMINSSENSTGSMTHKHVCLSVGEVGSSRVITCGYWDHSLKVHSIDSLREIASTSNGHLGAITCLQQSFNGGHTVVTGGADGTCRVWILEMPSLAAAFTPDAYYGEFESEESVHSISEQGNTANGTSGGGAPLVCVHVLCGHEAPVRCLSYSTDLDLVLSGSSSGLLCLHTVRRGQFIREIPHLQTLGASADVVLATTPGYLIAHSWSDLQLHLFWLNGQHLLSNTMPYRIECMVASGNGEMLVCGCSHGMVSIRAVASLQQVYSLDLRSHGSIKSLWFTEDNQFLMIGSEDGTFSVATDPAARWKLITSAIQKNPLLGSSFL